MNKVLFLSLFLFLTSSKSLFAQEKPLSADAILKEAYAVAKKENKNVLVMFHASWCGWCHKMDKSIEDESCKKYFDDNYVIRHLVVLEFKNKKHLENPGAEELRIKYNGDNQGIPFWLIFDKNGKLLSDSKMRNENDGPEAGQNSGCPANEKEVEFFISVLKKTSSLNDEQLDIIRKRFRKNEL